MMPSKGLHGAVPLAARVTVDFDSLSLKPWSSILCWADFNSLKGVFTSKPHELARDSSIWKYWNDVRLAQGLIAPSRSERLVFGTMRSGSNSSRPPRPSQVGQAPWGLLNENIWGVISG